LVSDWSSDVCSSDLTGTQKHAQAEVCYLPDWPRRRTIGGGAYPCQ